MKLPRHLEALFYVNSSPIHGKGLFAQEAIPADSYLGTYEGPDSTDNGMYVLWIEDEKSGDWIGRDGKNKLRYINHSDAPCAEFDGFHLYALEDIEPDQEITIHYGDEFVNDIDQ